MRKLHLRDVIEILMYMVIILTVLFFLTDWISSSELGIAYMIFGCAYICESIRSIIIQFKINRSIKRLKEHPYIKAMEEELCNKKES